MVIKAKIILIVFLLINTSFIYAGSESDTLFASQHDEASSVINIKEIVTRQIEAARQKQLRLNASQQNRDKIKTSTSKILERKSVSKSKVFSNMDLGLLVFIAVAITLLLIILSRRFKRNEIKADDDFHHLKRKIEMIRNEEPLFNEDKELREIRKSLYDKSLSNNEKKISSNYTSVRKKFYSPKVSPARKPLNEFDNDISKTAKRLNISKGELLLASKIKSIEMDKSYSI